MIIGSSNVKIIRFKRFYNYQLKSVTYRDQYVVAEAENVQNFDRHLFVYKANRTLERPENILLDDIYLYGAVKNVQDFGYTLNKNFFFLTDHMYQRPFASAQTPVMPTLPGPSLLNVNQSIVIYSPQLPGQQAFLKIYPIGMLKVKFLSTDYKALEPFSLLVMGPEGVIDDWKMTYIYMEKGKLSTTWIIILGVVIGIGLLALLIMKCKCRKNGDADLQGDGLELQWSQDEKIIDD